MCKSCGHSAAGEVGRDDEIPVDPLGTGPAALRDLSRLCAIDGAFDHIVALVDKADKGLASLRNSAVGASRRDGAQASSARTNRGGIANTLASRP